ncbi:MAG: helix-turn-helix domain-containing protein [Flavonifractor plautii]
MNFWTGRPAASRRCSAPPVRPWSTTWGPQPPHPVHLQRARLRPDRGLHPGHPGHRQELDEDALVTDFVNLYATTPSGQQIKSSTFHLIGEGYNLALGINFDYSSLVYANRILVDLMSAEADLQSALWHGGDSRLADVFDECLAAVGKPVSALNKRDRMKIIALLDQKNAFSFRKSVPFVAKRLQVSRYTVYKYLGELTGAHAEESEEE